MTTQSPRRDWRTPSYSDNGSACVEIHCELGAMRDSKNPNAKPLVADIKSLVLAVKADQLTA